MSIEDLENLNGFSVLLHIVVNDLVCIYHMLKHKQYDEAEHRIKGTLKSLESLVEAERRKHP